MSSWNTDCKALVPIGRQQLSMTCSTAELPSACCTNVRACDAAIDDMMAVSVLTAPESAYLKAEIQKRCFHEGALAIQTLCVCE